jgi:Flp pilus assembly protein protease CpaA
MSNPALSSLPDPWTASLLVIAAAIAVVDAREHRIPNRLTYPLLVLGLLAAPLAASGISPAQSLAGLGTGALISALLLALTGMGAGDAKLLTALGACLGAAGLLDVTFYGIVLGAAAALVLLAARGEWRLLAVRLRLWLWLLISPGVQPQAPQLSSRLPFGSVLAVAVALHLLAPGLSVVARIRDS